MEVKINIVNEGRSHFEEFSKLEDARDYLIKLIPNTMAEETPVVDTPEEEVAPTEEVSETVESTETEEVKEEATV